MVESILDSPKTSAMNFVFRDGELAQGDWEVIVNDDLPGWTHTGLRVGDLNTVKSFEIKADNVERLIWPLEGKGITVEYRVAGEPIFASHNLGGRESVFHGPADLIYLSINTEIKITGEGRFVIAEAPAKNSYPVKFIPADTVPVFIRGAGPSSRQVHNFGVPEELIADRFIVVEVIVPAGNWSGSPAHKHDTYIPGVESNLEEIYYFQTAVGRGLAEPKLSDPTGFFRGHRSDEREFDVMAEVRSRDVVLIPHGWHGPVMATPGYDLYFMNVMAGPDPDRSWNITDDPTQSWIRESWKDQLVDPRLPYQR
jgi:5-deoxy-glucuronate isomerase